MTEVQRWIGFASFMGMTLIGWCLALALFHPISGAPVIGYVVGLLSVIIALGIFEKRTPASTTVQQPFTIESGTSSATTPEEKSA